MSSFKENMKSNNSVVNFFVKYRVVIVVAVSIFFLIFMLCLSYEQLFLIPSQNSEIETPEDDVSLPSIEYKNIIRLINQSKDGTIDYSNILNKQVKTVDNLPGLNAVSQFGNLVPSYQSLKDLNKTTLELANDCLEPISFIMYDLNSDSGVYYSVDTQTYLASSIKLPYIASIIDEEPERYNENIDSISSILEFSSNEDYDYLWSTYGTARFQEWETEVNTKNSMTRYQYPSYVTALDMLKIWFKTFYVLNANMYGTELSILSSNSYNSAIYDALGTKYRISTKPGWFDCYEESDAGFCFDGITSDCGVVYAEDNPYLLVVLTEIPENVDAVSKLVKSIDQVHNSMVENLNNYVLKEQD